MMEVNPIAVLRRLGLIETLAFKFSNYNSFSKFDIIFDWGKGPWK